MNILVINEFYNPIQKGGAEVSVQLLAEEYKKNGNEVTVLTSSNRNEQEIINGINILRIKANPFGWFGHKEPSNIIQKIIWHALDSFNFLAATRFNRILKKLKPDIIHTNNLSHLSCIVWKIAKQNNIPICHTLRDYYLLCPKRSLFNHNKICQQQCLQCKLFSIPKKRLSNHVDAVVGISNYILQKHLRNGFFKNTIEKKIIFNSVAYTQNSFYKERTYNIGFLGQITKEKGVDVIIKAFMSCNNPKYSLLIAGKYNNLKEFKQINNFNHPNITFVGKVNRDSFFKQIDLLVVPSIWEEPFGRTVIEAISADVPVIAAAHGGITEILNNRNEGILFNSNNTDDLKNKLSDYMNGMLSFDFSKKQEFLAQFNQSNIATQYINIFKKIIDNKNKHHAYEDQ